MPFCHRIQAIVTTLLLFCAVSASAQPLQKDGVEHETVDRIVAIVNDDIIRLKELQEALAPIREKAAAAGYSRSKAEDLVAQKRSEVLHLLINRTLADQVIESEGISVSEEEIDEAIEQVKSANYYTDEALRRSLRMSGMDMESYRQEIRRQILQSKLVNRKVKSSIVITDEDVSAYYAEHAAQYEEKPRYRLRNIFIPCAEPLDNENCRQARQKIADALAALEEGVSFASAAERYSEGTNAEEGGELGKFLLEDLHESIKEIVSDMDPGQTSGIIETAQGFQIFQLAEIVQPEKKPLSLVSDEIRKRLYDQAVDKKFQEWIEGLRKEAHIKIID